MTSSSKHPTPPPARNLQITTTTAATAANNSSPSSSVVTHHHHHIPSNASIRPAPAAGGPNQACAACKYQRRKCNPDCPLARYFPADQQRRFLNAHRLFGVGNIQRTLRETPPDLRNDAMHSLIFQSEARAYDSVGGCYHMLLNYERQLIYLDLELKAVQHQLHVCRNQADGALGDDDDPGMMMMIPGAGPSASAYGVPMDALYAAGAQEIDYGQGASAQHYLLGAADQAAQQQMPHQLYDYFYYDGPAGDETSSHAWSNADNYVQQQQRYAGNNGLVVKAGSPVASLGADDQIETQFVDVFDVKPDIAAVVMEHDAASGDSFDHKLEGKVQLATVVKNEQLDRHQAAALMAVDSSTAASRCQLELGFSSF
ncbi:unnamed protein product [Alopecurus aequalis]